MFYVKAKPNRNLPEVDVNECYLFADDTKIISIVDNKKQLQKVIEKANV